MRMPNLAVHARVKCPYYRAVFQRKNGTWAIVCEGVLSGSGNERTVSEFRGRAKLERWMRGACETHGYCEVCAIARLNAGKYEEGEEDE